MTLTQDKTTLHRMLASLRSVDLLWKLAHSTQKLKPQLATQVAAACKGSRVAAGTVQHGHLWPGGLGLSNPQCNHPASTLSSMGITSQLLALHLRGLDDPRAV